MKKIIALVLSLALTLGAVFALASCGEPEPAACTSHKDNDGDGVCDNEGCGKNMPSTPPASENAVEYEITVTDESGNGVAGVVVAVETRDGVSEDFTTDANGKAIVTMEIESEGYVTAYAVVKEVPQGYKLPDSELIEDDKAEFVLEAATLPTEFTVKLVDADGKPLALSGFEIQLCHDSGCIKFPGKTDANGEIKYSASVPEGSELKIEITNIDAQGYNYVDTLKGGYIVFPAGTTVLEIKIAPKA